MVANSKGWQTREVQKPGTVWLRGGSPPTHALRARRPKGLCQSSVVAHKEVRVIGYIERDVLRTAVSAIHLMVWVSPKRV